MRIAFAALLLVSPLVAEVVSIHRPALDTQTTIEAGEKLYYELEIGEPGEKGSYRMFERTLIFEGVDGGQLLVTYREYVDGDAKPTHQKSLALAMTSKGEVVIHCHGARIDVHRVDRAKATYRVGQGFDPRR